MCSLLQHNSIRLHDAERYLTYVVKIDKTCGVISAQQTTHTVSVSALSRKFKEVLSLEDLCPAYSTFFHCIDAESSCSAGIVCDDTSIQSDVTAFETVWMSPNRPHDSVKADHELNTSLSYSKALRRRHQIRHGTTPRSHKGILAFESRHKLLFLHQNTNRNAWVGAGKFCPAWHAENKCLLLVSFAVFLRPGQRPRLSACRFPACASEPLPCLALQLS